MDYSLSQPSSPVQRRGNGDILPSNRHNRRRNEPGLPTCLLRIQPSHLIPWTRNARGPGSLQKIPQVNARTRNPDRKLCPYHRTDEDDDDDNAEDIESDMDNETIKNTDVDGDNETGHGLNETHDNDDNDDNDDDDEENDSQHSDEDPMDPAEYLDVVEDDYPSDDGACFATVSEAELPNSPVPHPVRLSLKKRTRTKKRNESAGAVAHDADALYKLAAVLPTQGGSPY